MLVAAVIEGDEQKQERGEEMLDIAFTQRERERIRLGEWRKAGG